jgi:hypothetical protein
MNIIRNRNVFMFIAVLFVIGGISLFYYLFIRSGNTKKGLITPTMYTNLTPIITPKPLIENMGMVSQKTEMDVAIKERYFEGGIGNTKYKIKILPGWQVERNQSILEGKLISEQTFITLHDNTFYKITISQGNKSNAKCVYDTSAVKDPITDIFYTDFVEINDQSGDKFRRSSFPNDNTYFNVCQYDSGSNSYVSPTNTYESIVYTTPLGGSPNTVKDMDTMITSLEKM